MRHVTANPPLPPQESTHPHHCEPLLAGWTGGCYWSTRIHKAANNTTMTGRGYDDDDAHPQQHEDDNASTNTNGTQSRTTQHPPHAHEPLLVGWLTGFLSTTKGTRGGRLGARHHVYEQLLVGWFVGVV
jgi:hypothetical protein